MTTHRRRSRRLGLNRFAAGPLTAALLLATGCGMDVQTTQPYTPAHGVNLDSADGVLLVRNLLVISGSEGEGVLSATLITTRPDRLLRVTGRAIAADATTSAVETTGTPLLVPAGDPLVLTEQPPIRLRADDDLDAGLTVELVLVFSEAGEIRTIAPVMSADEPEYQTVEPGPVTT